MARSICILFVALAIFQAVVGSVVERREIVNLNLTDVASLPINLTSVERGICNDKLLSVGKLRPDDKPWISEFNYNNNANVNMEIVVRLQLCCGHIAHYVVGVSRNLANVVFCETPQTLGTSLPEMLIKIPPHTDAKLFFAVASH